MEKIPARIFWNLYPPRPRKAHTPEAVCMRRILLCCLVAHVFFWFISLCFIGFLPMLSDLCFAFYVYSIYLTLYPKMTLLYVVLLALGAVYGFVDMFAFSDISLIMFIVNLCFYIVAIYFVAKQYFMIQASGGNFKKDKLLKKSKKKDPEAEFIANAQKKAKEYSKVIENA